MQNATEESYFLAATATWIGKDSALLYATAGAWAHEGGEKERKNHEPEFMVGVGARIASWAGDTTTSQQLMLRVRVDPATHDPADLPEFVAGGREWDDFLIDEEGGVAYVTTHRENTIDRVRLAHDGNREGRTVVAGDPFTDMLVGPSAGVWGRADGDYGRVAYMATDGGTALPPDGVFRTAKILRVEFPPIG